MFLSSHLVCMSFDPSVSLLALSSCPYLEGVLKLVLLEEVKSLALNRLYIPLWSSRTQKVKFCENKRAGTTQEATSEK